MSGSHELCFVFSGAHYSIGNARTLRVEIVNDEIIMETKGKGLSEEDLPPDIYSDFIRFRN